MHPTSGEMTMFAVYKVSGKHSRNTYYGYASGDETTNVREAFLKGALRNEEERGDVRFMSSNRDDEQAIIVEVVDVATDECEAVFLRNKNRVEDVASITGPTMWPIKAAQRAAEEYPEQAKKWTSHIKLASCKSARKAYEAGAYGFASITSLCAAHGRQKIATDLDQMSPAEFGLTYNTPLCPVTL
jgi:hypothetical protein